MKELQKLRKKINITVHVLSHYTEKLEFIHAANAELKQKLQTLEREQTKKRDELSTIKLDRDNLKEKNQRLRQETGLSGNEELLKDFREKRKKVMELKKELLTIERKYEKVTGENVMMFNEKLFRAADEGIKKGAEDGEEEEEEEEEDEEGGEIEQEEGDSGMIEEEGVQHGDEKVGGDI
jgi:hypothetical protein